MKKALLFLDWGYEGSFCGRFAKGLEGRMTSHLSGSFCRAFGDLVRGVSLSSASRIAGFGVLGLLSLVSLQRTWNHKIAHVFFDFSLRV